MNKNLSFIVLLTIIVGILTLAILIGVLNRKFESQTESIKDKSNEEMSDYAEGNNDNDSQEYCFPDNFDPKNYTLEKVKENQSRIEYKVPWTSGTMEIYSNIIYQEKKINNDIILRTYSVQCGYVDSPTTFEFYKDNDRLAIFIGVDDPYPDPTPINEDLGLYFLRAQDSNYIYNAIENQTYKLFDTDCTDLKAQWFGDVLFTSSRKSPNNNSFLTELNACTWSSQGQLLNSFSFKISFGSVAPGYLLNGKFGFFDDEYTMFYVYRENFDFNTNKSTCEVELLNINNNIKKTYIISDSSNQQALFKCKDVVFDFKNINPTLDGLTWKELN